ncbi:hypothetical protein MKW98_025187 [Papaver atlanticum]|uniref:BZIP domain-containing protein n=1 Tax=Papaver atlanticum TaxID=357466 RepID=A0AAD4S1L4_9MAGN|nr:hypothetical protein MKW98_025187 [Papaver atlanticum]
MDDGELDFSNQALKNMEHQFFSSCVMDSFFDDMLDDTHTRTCTNTSNQSEQDTLQIPELPRSPNYIHFLTQNPPVEEKTTAEDTDESVDKKSKKRPHGNRESVRKYRERKKARQASIEDELNRMRIVNQQLLKRMQGLVALEQEIARFKCLLVDIRGRIKGELGSLPYQKPANGNIVGAYDVNQCDHQYPGLNNNSGFTEFIEFWQSNVRFTTNLNTSAAAKKRTGKSLNKCLNIQPS